MTKPSSVLGLVCAALLLVLGCGDGSSGTSAGESDDVHGGGDSGDATSASSTEPELPPIGSGTSALPDATVPGSDVEDASGESSDEGSEVEFCEDGEDCDTGLCVRVDSESTEGVCTNYCVSDEECVAPRICVRSRFGGADEVAVCLDAELCIDRDGDGFGFGPGCLGRDCDDDDPETYFGADERCNGRDNSCNGVIDSNPVWGTVAGEDVRIGDDCDTGSPGVCAPGRWRCVTGNTICVALQEPEPVERCDSLDRTCDGSPDRDATGEPLSRACYSGSEETRGEGRCQDGLQVCADGEWPAGCSGEVLPREERCNMQDDDCDGVVDNVPAEELQTDRQHCGTCWNACEEHLDCRGGECRCAAGLSDCGEQCVNVLSDNRNCGECGFSCADRFSCEAGECVRIGCEPGTTRPCDNDCGEGIETCTEDGWTGCTAPALGVSRSCDGTCDTGSQTCTPDGWTDCTATPGGTQDPCTSSCGEGVRVCEAGGWTSCSAPQVDATRECGNACGEGLQTCTADGWSTCTGPQLNESRDCSNSCGAGSQTCTAAGWTQCTATPIGTVEGCVSSCGNGSRTCQESGWSSCSAPQVGATQTCQSTCGQGEETCTESGWRNCTAPILNQTRECSSICEGGTETCTSGGWSECTARVPADERCNLFDDLCDGTLDTGLSCRQPVHRHVYVGPSSWLFSEVLSEPGGALHAANVFWLYSTNAEGRAVPFYRCFNPEVNRHFLTADAACERWQPEHLERAIGYISPVARANTVPLYRSFDGLNSRHFYTIDANEHQTISSGPGVEDEGVVGHVWSGP